ncbi:MAG: hypothetical protein HPY75_08470 [Actinobacteria bacterium]|nr:hypothetical protein [Actinomycetota bacterium]
MNAVRAGWRSYAIAICSMLLGIAGCTSSGGGEAGEAIPQDAYRGREVENIQIIQENGGRACWSPDGDKIAFDRQNEDGYFDLYVMRLGETSAFPITQGNPGANQLNNGNPAWHPLGGYIVFVSEEERHYGAGSRWPSNPGIGAFCNLWATDEEGGRFWKLTDIPVKQERDDGLPVMGVMNPRFSRDGSRLMWTERYGEGGKWGRWRIKAADFRIGDDGPRLENETVLFQPGAGMGCYVTAMGFSPDDRSILLAGNLDGQDEFGMDQYVYDLETGELTNLQNSPTAWEEGACWSPDGKSIVYMTDLGSSLDFNDPHWYWQPRTGEYWIMNADGSGKRRLTYFNDPKYPEYVGKPVIAAVCSFDRDGEKLVGVIGVDEGTEEKADFRLQLVLIEMRR